MDGWRRLRPVVLVAALCLVATGCGTAGRCLPQPLDVMTRPVGLSQVERSVAVVTNCLWPRMGCRPGTAFPIGGGYWLTAASVGRNPGGSLIPGAPDWSAVTVISDGHRYPARPVRVSESRGYTLLDVPGTASARGLPLGASSPEPLDPATVVCAEPARTLAYSGSLFLKTPSAQGGDVFEVNSSRTIAGCAGGPVLDGGLVIGLQLFGVPGGAWAAPTSAMTGLPSTSTAGCES